MDRLYGINLIAVLIDAYENQEFSGRLMHPWSAEAIPFASCMELMTKMEALYDAWDYPEAAQGMRVFIRHRSDAAPRAFVSEKRLTELSKEQTPTALPSPPHLCGNNAPQCGAFLTHGSFCPLEAIPIPCYTYR